MDASSEFGIVVTYRLGRLRLLMAAEIDGQQPGGAPGPEGGEPYVEMKTYRCAGWLLGLVQWVKGGGRTRV